jgi:hypothetical protein
MRRQQHSISAIQKKRERKAAKKESQKQQEKADLEAQDSNDSILKTSDRGDELMPSPDSGSRKTRGLGKKTL